MLKQDASEMSPAANATRKATNANTFIIMAADKFWRARAFL
jgi:hypothetical protein